MKVRTIAIPVATGLAALTLGLSVPAMAGNTPTPTPTQIPVVTPTPTPTQLPTVPPTVNPFAGCNFSTSFSFTFDPARGRFVRLVVPAIVCDQGGRVRVFDLTPRTGR